MSLPSHVPPRTQSFSGQIPVRLDGAPAGCLAGMAMWRGVKSFEHAHLCRVFGLDPVRFYFDLPSTVRGIGPNNAGAAAVKSGRRLVNGFIMHAGLDKPVGKLTICFEGERFKDVDPMNERDFFDLSHS